jgi:hypothetical protein
MFFSILLSVLSVINSSTRDDLHFSGQTKLAWQNFIDTYGSNFIVRWNNKTEVPTKVFGSGIILTKGFIDEAKTINLAWQFINQNRNILKIKTNDLRLQNVTNDHENFYLQFSQIHENIPVFGGSFCMTIRKSGELVSFGGSIFPDIIISTKPQIALPEAINKIKIEKKDSLDLEESSFVILPIENEIGYVYRLSWKITVWINKTCDKRIVLIDATDGSILKDYSIMKKGSWTINGNIKGKIHEVHMSDPHVEKSYTFDSVFVYDESGRVLARSMSNENGYYSISGSWNGSCFLQSSLYGPYVRIKRRTWIIYPYLPFDWTDLEATHAYQFPNHGTTNHSWTWYYPQDDLKDEGVSIFWHMNNMRRFINSPPFNYQGINHLIRAYVYMGLWAASTDGSALYFGELAGIYWGMSPDAVYHEYGHCVIFNVYGGEWIGQDTQQSDAMDEGYADYLCGTITHDPDIAEDVGINRHLNNTLIYPDDMVEDAHLNGQIIGGAIWDLRTYVGQFTGDGLFRACPIHC